MITKTIAYTDFHGNPQEKEFTFNITKAELMEMQFSEKDGFDEWLKQIAATDDTKEILKVFKNIISGSYGKLSADGQAFVKSPHWTDAFYQTAAYDELFWELIQSGEKMAEFMNSLVPPTLAKDARDLAAKQAAEEGKTPAQIARERSEAALQGHKKAQPAPVPVAEQAGSVETVVIEGTAAPVLETQEEREFREWKEFRAFKAAQGE